MEQKRTVIFYRHYFLDFFENLPESVRKKINYVLLLVKVAEYIPEKFFKHITGTNGLFEIRIETDSNIYRIFCCFDKGQLVILFNGFQKKSQKTPEKEIDKALRIMDEYFNDKQNEKGK
jgi:phage-related protein